MQLKKPSHPTWGVPTAISCIAMLLKEPVVRSSFVQADGVKLLIPLISPASTQQSIQVSFVTFQIAGLINVFLPKYLSVHISCWCVQTACGFNQVCWQAERAYDFYKSIFICKLRRL